MSCTTKLFLIFLKDLVLILLKACRNKFYKIIIIIDRFLEAGSTLNCFVSPDNTFSRVASKILCVQHCTFVSLSFSVISQCIAPVKQIFCQTFCKSFYVLLFSIYSQIIKKKLFYIYKLWSPNSIISKKKNPRNFNSLGLIQFYFLEKFWFF